MSRMFLTESQFSRTKRRLRKKLPNVLSSHVDEALASALGFGSYGLMLRELRNPETERRYFELKDGRLIARLEQLGYEGYQHFSFEYLDT